MGSRITAARAKAAEKEGSRAYRQGTPRSHNPYKQGEQWCLFDYWDSGWIRESEGLYDFAEKMGIAI